MSFLYNQRFRKFLFYTKGLSGHYLVPNCVARLSLSKKLESLDQFSEEERHDIHRRVAHYCQLTAPFTPSSEACPLAEVPHGKTTYFIDYCRILRHFPAKVLATFRFGDVTDVTDYPRFVKTRPIEKPNQSSVILRLNSIRHFRPIRDLTPFREKKNSLVWRGKVKKDHRRTIFRQHFANPLCDLGKVDQLFEGDHPSWCKPFLSVAEQLRHKFIISIEGNDVATNLKWIAQSNSLCFMTRPKFESWFMEGSLQAGVHYVELQDDYSDLNEKLEYYLANPSEAEEIIAKLQTYYDGFRNPAKEELIGLLVAQKFLQLSGQIDSP